MPNLHDIERRINSVSSTKQITRTMEMISAAKIRRAMARTERAIPFSEALTDALICTAINAKIDSEPLLVTHDEVKTSLIIAVTSDRGLAGGFNGNVLRAAEKLIREKERQGIKVEVVACGKKAVGFFEYRNIKPKFTFVGQSADPAYETATRLMHYITKAYVAGDIDEVVMIYNHAKNSGEQTLIHHPVLPYPKQRLDQIVGMKNITEKDIYYDFREHIDDKYEGEIDFEPDASEVMPHLMRSYLCTLIYFALIDSAAAEQGARRTAMKSATDNATEMVNTLTRLYNRERQGAITTELNEIVGGAAALEE